MEPRNQVVCTSACGQPRARRILPLRAVALSVLALATASLLATVARPAWSTLAATNDPPSPAASVAPRKGDPAPRPLRQALGRGASRLDVVFGKAENTQAILYMHGLCGNPLAFGSWAEAAAEHGTLIAMRGDIRCKRRPRRFRWSLNWKRHNRRISQAIERVNRLRKQRQERLLRLDHVALIGYSQGARRVEWLAARFPQRFRRVAIIATAKEPTAQRLNGCESVLLMAGALDAKLHIRRAHQNLLKHGLRSAYLELPAARHGSYGPKAKPTMARGLGWLFAKTKGSQPSAKRPPKRAGLSKKMP